jgi:hypothetical protein
LVFPQRDSTEFYAAAAFSTLRVHAARKPNSHNLLGALRFRWVGEDQFQAPIRAVVPALIELGRLLQIAERILRDEETDEGLLLIFAPSSSLGSARPKASGFFALSLVQARTFEHEGLKRALAL